MKIHRRITLEAIENAIEVDEGIGFCIACGAIHYGIEPDARRYECEECMLPKVYGAEDMMLIFHNQQR